MTRSLAAAQTIPVRGAVDANLAEHVRLVAAAADERADIVVFPELSLTGYEPDLAETLAFSPSDPRLEALVRVASFHRITLVVGAPVRLLSRLYIGAFIISADGSVDVYTKHHLGAFAPSDSPNGIVPAAEATVFHPGDRNPLVRLNGSTAAIAVCADVGQPVHASKAAERGAQTYLASMFVIPSDLERDLTRLQTYAARHSLAVVFSNFGAASGGLPSGGCSAILTPTGEIVAQLGVGGSGVAVAREIDGTWQGRAIVLDS